MPRLSSRPIGAPAFAVILLIGVVAVTLIHSEKVVAHDLEQVQGDGADFDQGAKAAGRRVAQARARSGDEVLSLPEDWDGQTPMEKTDFSSPGKKLQIDEPKLFLATADKSSDRTTVSLTNSTDKIYAYTSSLDDLAAGFTVNVCSDGFVRANSHCALTIVYKPKLTGNSAARLSLRFIEVGGEEAETLTVMLSGFAMANCEVPAEPDVTGSRVAQKAAPLAAGCGETGGGDLAQVSSGHLGR